MSRFVHWIQALALAMGAPGIFLVALLDSSVLSLPEIADLLVIYMVTTHPARFLLYVVCATAGSLAGCLVLYYIGVKGGEAFMRRQFSSSRVDKTLQQFRRHGVMAVLIPSLLPPPAPFKPFVLLAGVAEISVTRFSTAILIGRGARYAVEGLLALWYGERAMTFIRQNGSAVALIAVGALALVFVLYLRLTRTKARPRAPQQE